MTERFQKISLEIIEIKKSLEEQDPPQTQSASMIARVQVAIYFVELDLQFNRKADDVLCAIPADEIICLMKSCQELEEKKLSTVVDLQLARQQVVEAVSFFELKSIQPASDNFCVCSTVCYSFRHWTILAMSSVRRMQTLSEQVKDNI